MTNYQLQSERHKHMDSIITPCESLVFWIAYNKF
jgi:hypothetical protein